MYEILSKKTIYLITIILWSIFYYHFGIYLEEEEVLVNQFIVDLSNQGTIIHPISGHYGLVRLMIWAQNKFPNINIRDIVFFTSLLIGVTGILFTLISNYKNIIASSLILIIAFSISAESIFLVSSSKVSILLCLSSIFIIKHYSKSKVGFIVSFAIGMLAVSSRFEYAFIFYTGTFVFSILFKEKKLRYFSLLFIIFSSISIFTFQSTLKSNYTQKNDFHKYEKWIYHRMDSKLEPSTQKDNSQLLLFQAKGLFLLDEPTLDKVSFEEIVKHKSLTRYIFNNPGFSSIFFKKLNTAFDIIKSRFLPLLLASILTLFLFILYAYKKRVLLRAILFILFYLSIFIAINILAELHSRFLSSYFLIPTLIGLYLLNNPQNLNKNTRYFSLLLYCIFAFVYIRHTVPKILTQKVNLERRSQKISASFESDITNQHTPFIGYLEYNGIFTSKLFSVPKYNFYSFLDAGPANNDYNQIYNKKQYFGKSYLSLPSRMETIIQREDYIYSQESYIQFYQKYLEHIHHFTFQYKKIESFGDNFNKYRVFY